MLKLHVIAKPSYGHIRLYPICEDSKTLCQFSKRDTFTLRDKKLLESLGFEFMVERELMQK